MDLTPDQRLDKLIAAKLSGTLDLSGQAELEELLRAHPGRAAELALLEKYWQEVPAAEAAPADDIFQRIMTAATAGEMETTQASPGKQTKNIRINYRWWKWSAAALVAGVLLCVLYFPRGGKLPVLVQTANGERRSFQLSDGSIIHLNGGSKLSARVDGQHREMWLEGEAYFEVAADPGRPFVVHAGAVNIRALGTAFNVKAYPGQRSCETTLLQGAVEVYANKTPTQKIRLRPYEKLALDAENMTAAPVRKIALKPVHAAKQMARTTDTPVIDSTLTETAWVSNRLQFDAMNFEELAQLLQRWYGVQISFRDEKLKHYIFSGAFAGESVTQALEALQLTEDFKFDVRGNSITIY